jgi:ABC-2 type transport system permease protein
MTSVLAPVKRVAAAHELLWNLTLRELRTKYRRSFLGWTWSMLNPLATVAVYAFVFGHLFQASHQPGDPSGVDAYALYLLCGLLPWNCFTMVSGLGMGSVLGNSALVKKAAFPREVLVFAQSMHGLVQFSIEMGILAVIMLIAGSMFLPWLPVILVQMLLLLLFATGIGLGLAAINVYFRDVSYLWEIFTRVLFFATPIVYSPDILEGRVSGWVEAILRWNPMAVFIRGFRHSFYDGAFVGWAELGAAALAAFISMTLGWMIFTKMSRRFAEEI